MNFNNIYHFDHKDWSGNTWRIIALNGGKYRAEQLKDGNKIAEHNLSANSCANLVGVSLSDLPLPRLNLDMKALRILPKLPKRTEDGKRIVYQLRRFMDLSPHKLFYDDVFSPMLDCGRIEQLYSTGGYYLSFGIYVDEKEGIHKIPLSRWVVVEQCHRNPLP